MKKFILILLCGTLMSSVGCAYAETVSTNRWRHSSSVVIRYEVTDSSRVNQRSHEKAVALARNECGNQHPNLVNRQKVSVPMVWNYSQMDRDELFRSSVYFVYLEFQCVSPYSE
jgi:hypothetical protein